jgi:nicotinamide-nucleotide amidase
MLATAESCTGGMIAAACTDLAGSSQWFERGFVTYSNAAKTELLGVPAALIEQHGAVSEARGPRHGRGALRASRPGQRGRHRCGRPTGGSADKPVGTVWLAACATGTRTASASASPATAPPCASYRSPCAGWPAGPALSSRPPAPARPTMAEPFKNLINSGTVAQAGRHLQRAWPAFDRARFDTLATNRLEALELKARAMHLADALGATLPGDFAQAADLIEASLAPPLPLDDRASPFHWAMPSVKGASAAGWSGRWARWWCARAWMTCRARCGACMR